MTGNTKLHEFNNFFIKNYKYLLGFTRSIDVHNDYESLLHDCYIKCHKRIDLSGYSGNTYLNFVRVTIINTYKTKYRDRKDFVAIDTCGEDGYLHSDNRVQSWNDKAEQRLLDEYEYDLLQKEYDAEMSFYNTMVYEYVNKYFSPKENMIFKTYYVLKHKHLNYKQLSEVTNLSQSSVSNTIKNIKKSLKHNLLCYLNTGLNKMELHELITKVENILKTNPRANKQNYMELYYQVFGKHWSGCNCNTEPMRQALIQWLNKNKQNLN